MESLTVQELPRRLFGLDWMMRRAIVNMFNAITELKLWNEIVNRPPGAVPSFLPCAQAIGNHEAVAKDEHSGASFNMCMGVMIEISELGWKDFYAKYT
jgi:hypothetical protein